MANLFNIARFENPHLLWFLLLLIPIIAYYIYRTLQGGATIQVSSIEGIRSAERTAKYYLRHLPFILRCIAYSLLIVAIARPQNTEHLSSTTVEGIDIVVAIDVSGSMLARDFKPDRMTVAKEVASKFIVDRKNDRIGIVVFAGESYTQAPLTTDKSTLLNLMNEVNIGVIDDGTAIGNGLATSVNRLRESNAESKVVILLTDGVNNAGEIAPLTAADLASAYGVRVYTIGVGSMGTAPSPHIDRYGNIFFAPARVEIDEEVLTEIANQTGGRYFRATDKKSLTNIYETIDELETSKIETSDYTKYNELFGGFVLAALLLLIIEFALRFLWLRRIP